LGISDVNLPFSDIMLSNLLSIGGGDFYYLISWVSKAACAYKEAGVQNYSQTFLF
jgi:hypothetical protein